MPRVADIEVVTITLRIDGELSLLILLARDGSINRFGTGTGDDAGRQLVIGITQQPLFAQLLQHVDDRTLDHLGGYEDRDRRGRDCVLSVGFSFRDAEENGFRFRYGSESLGPPPEIGDFVRLAIDLTDPWYEEQCRQRGPAEGPSAST